MSITRDELKMRVDSIAADLKEAQFDIEHLQAVLAKPETLGQVSEVTELNQLRDRMIKLENFIYSPSFDFMDDPADRDDMHHQLRAMRSYYTALNSRLTRAGL